MDKQLELEETIVGIILRNPNIILSEPIEIRWFKHLKRPIEAMLRMASDGTEIDALMLSEKLGRGTLSDVVRWQKDTPGAASNFSKYLEKIKEEFKAEAIKNALQKSLSEIGDGAKSNEVLSGLLSDSKFIQNYSDNRYRFVISEAMNKFFDYLDMAYESKKSGKLSVKSGIQRLDNVTGGMHPSDLIVVGARPGVGKTAFGISVILNAARSGKKIGFISTEMSVIQIMSRLTSMVSGTPAAKIREVDLNENDFKSISEASSEILNFQLFTCDNPIMTAGDVSMQCRAWDLQHGLDLVIVDYLTRIKPDRPTGHHHLDVANVITSMKNLARTLNIPVIVLAQLNRNIEQRADKRPLLSDLRDSGVIEQEADVILMLHRPSSDEMSEERNDPQILVQKNRHGESDYVVFCKFVPEIMRWESL